MLLPATLVAQAALDCPPPVLSHDKYSSLPEVQVSDATFEGNLQMPIADQAQIAASLKQRSYTGDLDVVTSELREGVRQAWQEHGYFKVRVRGNATVLMSGPVDKRIAVTFQVDEGQQYRLGGITFKNNRVIGDHQALRDLFPIKDGELYNAALVGDGLEKLRGGYGQIGYINFTSTTETRIREEDQTLWLDIDIDEGKQFYISSINVLGLDEYASRQVLKDFLQRPGDVYNQRLVVLSMKRVSALPPSTVESSERHLDLKAGTVSITVSFRHCQSE